MTSNGTLFAATSFHGHGAFQLFLFFSMAMGLVTTTFALPKFHASKKAFKLQCTPLMRHSFKNHHQVKHNNLLYHRNRVLLPLLLCRYSSSDHSSSSSSPEVDDAKRFSIIFWSATTLLLAAVDRVLQKLAVVPMKDYPFFLAQLNTFVYVAVYSYVLHMRHRAGVITDEMLAVPKSPFIIIGFLESVAIVSGMYAGAILPGPAIPLLQQTFLVWQLVFSSIFLRRRYSLTQIVGCFLVAAGVIVAVTSGSNKGQMLAGVGIMWPALMIASSAFQAGASIVKESVFLDAATRLKGKSLDVFIVNSFGSGFQALFVLLLLPMLCGLKGIPLSELPLYFKSGAACFLNIGTNATTGCEGAPLLPLLYVIVHILFSISILNMLKISNAVVAALAVRASVPFSIYVLSLPLPYLPKGVRLSHSFHLGSLILALGLIVYNVTWPYKQESHVL